MDVPWSRVIKGVATGGLSEVYNAATGAPSIYDPVLNAAGLGIPPAPGKAPDPTAAFGPGSEQAKALYEQAMREAGYTAPTHVTTPNQITPTLVSPERVEGLPSGITHQGAPIERIYASQVLAGPDVSVGNVNPVERIQSTGELRGTTTPGTTVGRSTINPEAQRLLYEAATGQGESAALAQQRAGMDAIAQKVMSIAHGARGAERAGARRDARLQLGQQGADLVNQQAALRAQEMAQNRGAFAQHATQIAQLEQEQNSLQAQIDAARRAGDTARADQLTVRQHELEQQRQSLNAAAENTREMDLAQLRVSTGLANRGQNIAVGTTNAGNALNAAGINAGAFNAQQESLARRQDETEEQWLNRLQQTRIVNAANNLAGQTTNAGNALNAATQNVHFGLTAQQLQDQQAAEQQRLRLQAMGLAGAATGQTLGAEGAIFGAQSDAYRQALAAHEAAKNARLQAGLTAAGYAFGGPAGGAAAKNLVPPPPAYTPPTYGAGSYDPSGVMRY